MNLCGTRPEITVTIKLCSWKKQITLEMRTWRGVERDIIWIALRAIGIWGAVRNLWWSLFFSAWLKISQYHRISGWKELEGMSGDYLDQLPLIKQSHPEQVAQHNNVHEGLDSLKRSRLHNFSGQTVPGLKAKMIFIMFRWNFCVLVCADREIWRYWRRVENDFRPTLQTES